MRAFTFSGNEHTYTNSFAVEITDAESPYYQNDGNPESINIPTAFRKYKTVEELSQAAEQEGEFIGKEGCVELWKFNGKLVALEHSVVWMLSYKKKGAKAAFMEQYRDADWMETFRK